jgi:hypothetical protein
MRRLADFLAESGSPLMPAEAVNEAIDQWIAAHRARLSGELPVPTRGYRWKSLFLPEGTRLRMHFGGRSYDAAVEGDDLVFEGHRMSPRQMTLAVSGQGYNAWRALWVLLPGKIRWRPASVLRREAEQQETKPVSPLEALNAAAACMSETVKTAMALVDHAKAQAQPNYDRRIVRRRRASDSLEDACMED